MTLTSLVDWEVVNQIETVNIDNDQLFAYDPDKQNAELSTKPWTKNAEYFNAVKISALALIKMTVHSCSGGDIEVMGLMLGKISGRSLIVVDSFALPVEGTETRVNAAEEGYEYMVQYMDKLRILGRQENVIGWYHSHPGYGCWLSGIDVGTQTLHQRYSEPYLAIVIDPHRTLANGKMEIGAFRVYPDNHQQQAAVAASGDINSAVNGQGAALKVQQQLPADKLADFGVHASKYYKLDVTYYKSTADQQLIEALWLKFWPNTLSGSVFAGQSGQQSLLNLKTQLQQYNQDVVGCVRSLKSADMQMGGQYIQQQRPGPGGVLIGKSVQQAMSISRLSSRDQQQQSQRDMLYHDHETSSSLKSKHFTVDIPQKQQQKDSADSQQVSPTDKEKHLEVKEAQKSAVTQKLIALMHKSNDICQSVDCALFTEDVKQSLFSHSHC